METVFLVGGMALVTFLIRYGLLAFSGRIQLSGRLRRALGYVPPAVLTAIIVSATLAPDGQTLHLSWRNPYLAGAVFTGLIGIFNRQLLVTIVVGMGGFMAYQWVLRSSWF
jgi:branched-subunit amino acid transport protein